MKKSQLNIFFCWQNLIKLYRHLICWRDLERVIRSSNKLHQWWQFWHMALFYRYISEYSEFCGSTQSISCVLSLSKYSFNNKKKCSTTTTELRNLAVSKTSSFFWLHCWIYPNIFVKMFSEVPVSPPDPIFGMNQSFNEDPNPAKVNLGIGAYRDDFGKPYVLEAVKQVNLCKMLFSTFQRLFFENFHSMCLWINEFHLLNYRSK